MICKRRFNAFFSHHKIDLLTGTNSSSQSVSQDQGNHDVSPDLSFDWGSEFPSDDDEEADVYQV